jgi:flagellar hook-associated protein FlgK
MGLLASIASTGLQASQLRVGASAHNVANMNTPGFRRHAVVQEALPGGAGVQAAVHRQPQEGVVLEQEAVEQLSATYAFKANLQVLKAEDQMMGSLLDVRA